MPKLRRRPGLILRRGRRAKLPNVFKATQPLSATSRRRQTQVHFSERVCQAPPRDVLGFGDYIDLRTGRLTRAVLHGGLCLERNQALSKELSECAAPPPARQNFNATVQLSISKHRPALAGSCWRRLAEPCAKLIFWCGTKTLFLGCCARVCVLFLTPAPRGSVPSPSAPFRLCRHAGLVPTDVMETVVLARVIHVRTASPTRNGLFLTLPPLF